MAKILIVDDVTYIRMVYKEFLESKGYDAIEAESGKLALKLIREEKPDLVLMDINMPELSGIEVLQRMRKFDKTTPVLMLTAYGTVDKVLAAQKHGITGYVTKPVNLNDLSQRVIKILNS